MMNQTVMEKLDLTALIKYSVENIHRIKNRSDVVSHFGSSLEDITESAHLRFDLLQSLMFFNKYIGQKNYFYKFIESNDLGGEIMMDFIPDAQGDSLINFKVTLFANGILSKFRMGRAYKTSLKYLINQYGLPNYTPEAIELLSMVSAELGNTEVNCWCHKEADRIFVITIYLGNTAGIPPLVSFAIAEYV